MTHTDTYFAEVERICWEIDRAAVEVLADQLARLRDRGGRLFIAGLGGSAANASHAVNDLRKLCDIEAYCMSDNVAELTARANDEGWDTIFCGALQASRANDKDALLVLSVGGGTEQVSLPLVRAVGWCVDRHMTILGILGRDGGYTKRKATACVIVPTVSPDRITPHTEAFQSVILHLLVSHPSLQRASTKW